MKKLLIALLALIPGIAPGSLIDLTPGGFDPGNPFPLVFNQWLGHKPGQFKNYQFFDSMYAQPANGFPAGWVSLFGALNGGTYFFADIDVTGPVPTTTISWDFTGTDFYLKFVLADGFERSNLFAVPYLQRLESSGTIVIDGIDNIQNLSFYGNIPGTTIPDAGSTIGLFFIGLASLYPVIKKGQLKC